ncbi:anti-sigma factor [Pelagicoccus sp. SDUM812002]|uniref:anti-sigma factor n=1 Tax=Pelagicoccus sp. SDUM812002 TaxID=3041266 RepID=UPI00280C96F4|nr:anti-sigma factor [Pelagicoccus sp. SDUM812002]MDQ8186828.1 anti-sigma factor [Pelagicoccus sp. SDUM812002]
MSRDELQELAALYAVDLLEGDELLAFESELDRNPEAKRAVERYAETSDLLALTADEVEPPADLEERIMGMTDQSEEPLMASGGDADAAMETKVVGNSFSWIPWGLAAAFAITSLVLWNQRTDISQRLASLQAEYAHRVDSLLVSHLQEMNDLEAELRQLESDGALQNLRIAVLKSQLESAPNAQAVAVWNASQQSGRLTVSQLPALSSDQDYQLWIIDPAYESPVSAGVFNTNEEGTLEYAFSGSESIADIDAFALSLEAKGGSDTTPKGPIILMGN